MKVTGSGAAVPTGPTTTTSGHCAQFTGTAGQLADSGEPCGGTGAATWLVDEMTESAGNVTTSTVGLGPLGWQVNDSSATWATGASATISNGHQGIWVLNSGSASNAWATMFTGQNFTIGSSSGTNKMAAEVYVVPGAELSFAVGFGSAGSSPNPTDELTFRCDEYDESGSTNWYSYTSSGPAEATTSVSCSSAWHQLEIVVSNTTATFYIDNVSVGSGVTASAGTYGIFISAWNHLSSSSEPIYIDWIAVPSNGMAASFQ